MAEQEIRADGAGTDVVADPVLCRLGLAYLISIVGKRKAVMYRLEFSMYRHTTGLE